MPNFRALVRVAHVPLLETFQDAPTMKLVLVTTDVNGYARTCSVAGQPLGVAHSSDEDQHWIFTGRLNGDLWQIDLWDCGAEMTGRATTRA